MKVLNSNCQNLWSRKTLRKKMGKNAILKAQEFEFAKILDLWKRQL